MSALDRGVRLVANPFRRRGLRYGEEHAHVIDPVTAKRAREELRSWPVYARTPLHELRNLAREVGVATIWMKDEGSRLPLKSFKSLGGAYALGEHYRDVISLRDGRRPSYPELFRDLSSASAPRIHAVASTDGNHGRSLAWGASVFRSDCTIYLPRNVAQDRVDAIESLGARTHRVDGNYEDALRSCAADAAANGWVHVQDTSYEGFTSTHRTIMHGYTLMAEEALDDLGPEARPTHAFLQVGCGGMATTMTAHLWSQWGSIDELRTIAVQSTLADPLVRTFETRKPYVHTGSHDTLMAGIACGEIAALSVPILFPALDFAMAIDDEPAVEAMRLCASGTGGDVRVVAGETGAAGLAALLVALRVPEIKRALGLDSSSRVLLINTEGDTSPEVYERLVGCSAAEVYARSAGATA